MNVARIMLIIVAVVLAYFITRARFQHKFDKPDANKKALDAKSNPVPR